MIKSDKFFWVRSLWSICLLLLLSSCASTGAISGGPKDTKPPVLDSLKSSPPFAVNTNQKQFNFYFNELVEAKETIKEVLVSPPLIYIPKITSRGKHIKFEFNEKEVLKENTTYIINFGQAIRDLNEGNKLTPFNYVFSTGSIIDSLEAKGTIYDLNDKPMPDVAVMLYDDMKDSTIIRKKPYYAAKTNKEGQYVLKNIKQDTFRIIAIKDENNNLLYDESKEAIAFDTAPLIWDTSLVISRDLYISNARPTPRIINKTSTSYGLCKIKLNTKLSTVPKYSLVPPLYYQYLTMKEDSLILYYQDDRAIDSLQWILLNDTLDIKIMEKSTARKKLALIQTFPSLQLLPRDSLHFEINGPIDSYDASKIRIGDSLSTLKIDPVITRYDRLTLTASLASNHAYSYTFLPGAITDKYGNINDTLNGKFTTIDVQNLSSISIELTELDSHKIYIIALEKNGVALNKQRITNTNIFKAHYKQLKSDEYSLSVLEDDNDNGVVDPSSYWLKKQAERLKLFKLEKLRESWDNETKLAYKNKGEK